MTRRLTVFSPQATQPRSIRALFAALTDTRASVLCGVDTRRLPRSFCSIPPSLRGCVAACEGEWIRFQWEPDRLAPAVENRSLTTLKLTTINFSSARVWIRVMRRFQRGAESLHITPYTVPKKL